MKAQDTRKALLNDTAVDVFHTIEAWILRESLLSLDLATIKDSLCFIIATSRGIIDDGLEWSPLTLKTPFAEWFSTGFARMRGYRIDKEVRRAVQS